MAHGARKWSNVGADETVHGLADMGELAARIGSVDTHNREGNVVFIETFEHGIQPWNPSAYGTGSEVIVSAQLYRSSGYSCKLVAGSDDGLQARIFRHFPYPSLSRYGLEMSFLPGSDIYIVGFRLARMDGTNEHRFYAKYDDDLKEILIRQTGSIDVTVATDIDLTWSFYPMHTMKLVADFEGDEFVRLIVNESEYDVSGYGSELVANTDPPHLRLGVLLAGHSGVNSSCWVDDIILTQNEPS